MYKKVQHMENDIEKKAIFALKANDVTLRLLAIIVLIGFILRIFYSFYLGLPWFSTDTFSYFEMADGILFGKPISFFPNGYPLIVAGVKFFVGKERLPLALIILNILLSSAIIPMSFLIAKKFLNTNQSLFAAFLVAIWPNQLNYVRQLLSEVPSTFFLVFAVYLTSRTRQLFSVPAGALFFFSGMIRSTIFPVGWLSSFFLFVIGWKKKAFLLTLGLVISLFASEALYRSEVIRPPSNLGDNLLLSISNSSEEGIDWASVKKFSDHERRAPYQSYISFAISKPTTFTRQRLSAFWELWGPWPNSGDKDMPRPLMKRILIGIRFAAFLLALFSAIKLRSNPYVILCSIPIVIITAIHTATFSGPRFTYTIEPLLLILTAAGFQDTYRFFGNISRKFSKRIWSIS